MNETELKNVLEQHTMWLEDNETGQRADLSGANLCGAKLSGVNLRGANLRCANLSDANLSGADLCGADLSCADLRYANLCGADLSGADLRCANLRDANIDYSSWGLSCKTKDVTVDRRIAAQLSAHFCVLVCDDPDYQAARLAVLEFAKTSHRAENLSLLEEVEE